MPELYNYDNLASFLLAALRKTSAYSIWNKAIKYTRRFMFFTRIFTYIRIAVSTIEASAVLILFAAITVVLLPLVLIVLIGFFIADTVNSRHILRSNELDVMLKKKRVYIICGAGKFGEAFARELSKNAAVFILTASTKKHFISASVNDGVWYIRHAFYFKLKRKRLPEINAKITYLM